MFRGLRCGIYGVYAWAKCSAFPWEFCVGCFLAITTPYPSKHLNVSLSYLAVPERLVFVSYIFQETMCKAQRYKPLNYAGC